MVEPSRKNDGRSRFLMLPAELRTKIYKAVLGGHTIHIGGTGHQPYSEGYLESGRCSSCTAKMSDDECFAKYTGQERAFRGVLPEDRFAKRHRDCHRYPVSYRLKLNVLTVCKQIHNEAAAIVFEENTFTLARPHSLPSFLERLTTFQLKSLRSVTIYSVESASTWIGPFFREYDFDTYLTGFQNLRVYVELKPHDVQPALAIKRIHSEQFRRDWRLSGLIMFRLTHLKEVKFMVVTPDWYDVEAEKLSERTLNSLQDWEASLQQLLLPPLLPLQRLLGR